MSAQKLALTNGQIVLPAEIVSGAALLIEGERIAGIVAAHQVDDQWQRVDVGGRFITPGLIDIHTHGALGYTFNDSTHEAFTAITGENLRRGVTSILAATVTAPVDLLVECLEFARGWMGEQHDGATILGIHVEGPYFHPAEAGAQNPAHVLTPDDGAPARLLAYDDIIRIFTYAPELPGALELTQELTRRGIIPAAGHSTAREEEVRAAIDLGLRHIIHIWSAQSTTVRQGPWRKPGLLEVSLAYDNLTVEMICDNKHLPRTLMTLAYKAIGPDRLCVISDATSAAGLPDGARFWMAGTEYEVCDGVGMLFDRSAFAGSAKLLNEMIPVLTNVVGIPLPEAIRMATLNPARVIGEGGRKGSLEAGKDADVAVFNDDFTAWGAMIAGRWVYRSEALENSHPHDTRKSSYE